MPAACAAAGSLESSAAALGVVQRVEARQPVTAIQSAAPICSQRDLGLTLLRERISLGGPSAHR